MDTNYWAVLISSVFAIVLGAIWYGPLFGKKWLEVTGMDKVDMARRQEMMKNVWKLYITQFLLCLFQVLVLAHLINDTVKVSGLERSLWIWAAFIMPMIASGAMWNNDSARVSWARFLIQAGYQLVCFVVFGLILGLWR
ncbi:MAG: DUF1761 domain-containing protein [Patescibacteria group bacterium]